MRTSASPGSRLLVGPSGVVFEVTASVASGLVASGTARYADEAAPTQASPRLAKQAQPDDDAIQAPRRGRPPKRPEAS